METEETTEERRKKKEEEEKALILEHKKRVDSSRTKATILGLILILALSIPIGLINFWFGVGIFMLLGFIFLENGWNIITADPPHIGIVTVWGRRMHKSPFREGWIWLPFYGLLFELITINFERKPLQFRIQTRAFDKSELEIPVGLAVRVNFDNTISFLDSGKIDEVKSHLEDSIDERLREWALSRVEGPASWDELMESGVEAVSILVRKIVPKGDLPEMPGWAQKVPTSILLQFFKEPRPKEGKVMINTEEWAKNNWKEVKDRLKEGWEERKDKDGLGDFEIEMENLKKKVEARRELLKELQRGSGTLKISSLGIIIERLNVGKIKLLGDAAKMADKKARESIEAEADKIETNNVRERIKDLESDGFSKKEAKEIVQSERGKIGVNVNEHKVSVSDDSASKEVLKHIASKIFGG